MPPQIKRRARGGEGDEVRGARLQHRRAALKPSAHKTQPVEGSAIAEHLKVEQARGQGHGGGGGQGGEADAACGGGVAEEGEREDRGGDAGVGARGQGQNKTQSRREAVGGAAVWGGGATPSQGQKRQAEVEELVDVALKEGS